MKKWLARRFKWVRELEDAVRERNHELKVQEGIGEYFREMVDEYREMQVQFSKLTLDEARELFSCVVDYQRALRLLAAADPVQHRIEPIMEKYAIKIERNTIAEDSIKAGKALKESA